ncbi:MAG: NCS2 family permease [Planctomycetota bacterium]|nr:MAG: NCS2 family permease [Planctomycetota bacterium]
MSGVDRFFGISAVGSNLRREIVGGIVTFMTLSYIIFVQPAMLSEVGAPYDGVLFATCVASAIACFFMGLFARYPIALAPAMGHNAFFVYTVCLGLLVAKAGIDKAEAWKYALLANFISGVVFLGLSFTRVRRAVMDAVPDSIKYAIAVGIGLFITLIGLQYAGIVVPSGATGITLGNLGSKPAIVSLVGVAVVLALLALRIPGAILFGIIASTVMASVLGAAPTPEGVVSAPPDPSGTLFALFKVKMSQIPWAIFIQVLLVFLFLDMFDTVGTLIGVGEQAGLLKDGKLERAERALLSDAVGTVSGTLLGTSTVTSYIESAAGVAYGARTGLAAVVVGVLFVVSLFFYPLIKVVGAAVPLKGGFATHPMVAPALIVVGAMMFKPVKKIALDKLEDALPAFLTIVIIPFTFSITDGIAAGFISYALFRLVRGKVARKDIAAMVIAAAFVFYYIIKP